ncbi:MAG TPA: tetratricopeptide repeat protein [Chitinophagales bacterium]|nr:tetratricopeptide repeat protein [Chitinophagales bacterium]
MKKFILLTFLVYQSIHIAAQDSSKEDSKATEWFGYLAQNEGNYLLAIKHFSEALSIDSTLLYLYLDRAICYKQLKKYDAAIKDLKRLVELNIRYVDSAYYNLGNIYRDMKYYDMAIMNYKKAIAINNSHYQVYYNMANTYYDQQKYLDAIYNYKKSISINSNYSKPYYNLAIVYQNLMEFDKSIEYYTKYLQKVDTIKDIENIVRANLNCGLLYLKIKNYEKSISHFKSILKYYNKKDIQDINIEDIYYNLAISYYYKKEYSEACKYVKILKNINSEYDNIEYMIKDMCRN